MALNIGYRHMGGDPDDPAAIYARIYYDTAWLDTDPTRNPDDAPLVNGPRGYCLDMVNRSGGKATLTVYGVGSTPLTIAIQQGDPVISGPPNGRSRTAAQMAQLGFTTRGNVGSVSIE